MVTYVWKGGHNGHYEVYNNNGFFASCDESDLHETLKEAKEEENEK